MNIKDARKKLLENPEIKKEYDALTIREELIQQILALPEMQDEQPRLSMGGEPIMDGRDLISSRIVLNDFKAQLRQKITTLGEI